MSRNGLQRLNLLFMCSEALPPSAQFIFSPCSGNPSARKQTTPLFCVSRQCSDAMMHQNDPIAQQKRVVRSKVRKELKAMTPEERSQQETGKKLYVPRVEDKNSHMRMLKISSTEDLIANSMQILEPAPTDAYGNQLEDVMEATHPVDLLLLPGLAFDRSGRRLGRGGGYYDAFLNKYRELVEEKKWKQPLLVALSYSLQIMEEGVIPVTPKDVPVDALVSPTGVIPITPAAAERL